jgi:hypothetical protein
MPRTRTLLLKKEVLAELTTDELRSVVAGDTTGLSDRLAVCQKISLAVGGDCLRPTCGPGCTAQSTFAKGV